MVAALFQNQGVGRNRFVPLGPFEYGPKASFPEVSPSEYGTSARGARRDRDMRVSENCPLGSDFIEVRGINDLVNCASIFELPIGA